MSYLSSTSAPASSNDFLIPSASSLDTPSLTALGALSTISLASFKPRPVNSLTNLTTASLEPPGAFKITSNSDFSSAASPPSAAPPPAATATAAAAAHSHFRRRGQKVLLLLLQKLQEKEEKKG